KPILAECAVEILSPISREMTRLMQNADEIDSILASGAKRAREIASPILEKTYDIVGMLKPK
ncbi:MAG: tryptophan--tRNA ligase, partial [Pseudomonadota bacterium]|nr:tryptophan--tRNA ligase [Pseudomonadota bacterium]